MSVRLVVLDTNILVSALLSPNGNPAKIYKMLLTGVLSLAYNADIYEEYHDVLSRTRLRIPTDDMETVLAVIRQRGKRVDPIPSTNAMPDEDDRIFYDTAKTAHGYLFSESCDFIKVVLSLL